MINSSDEFDEYNSDIEIWSDDTIWQIDNSDYYSINFLNRIYEFKSAMIEYTIGLSPSNILKEYKITEKYLKKLILNLIETENIILAFIKTNQYKGKIGLEFARIERRIKSFSRVLKDEKLKVDNIHQFSNTNQYIDIILTNNDIDQRINAINLTDNELFLYNLILNDYDYRIRYEAIKQISDTKYLKNIIYHCFYNNSRCDALKKVISFSEQEQNLLSNLILDSISGTFKYHGVQKITINSLFEKIIVDSKRKHVIVENEIIQVFDREVLLCIKKIDCPIIIETLLQNNELKEFYDLMKRRDLYTQRVKNYYIDSDKTKYKLKLLKIIKCQHILRVLFLHDIRNRILPELKTIILKKLNFDSVFIPIL